MVHPEEPRHHPLSIVSGATVSDDARRLPEDDVELPPIPEQDTAQALVSDVRNVLQRVERLAPFATPSMRLRLRGELALVERVVTSTEQAVEEAAKWTLEAMRDSVPRPVTKPERARPAKVANAGMPPLPTTTPRIRHPRASKGRT